MIFFFQRFGVKKDSSQQTETSAGRQSGSPDRLHLSRVTSLALAIKAEVAF